MVEVCPKEDCDYETDSENGLKIHWGSVHDGYFPGVTEECKNCGEDFHKDNGRFCGRECYDEYISENGNWSGNEEYPYHNKEWLEQKRIEEDNSVEDIADMFDVDVHSVWKWVNKHDVYGENAKTCHECGGKFERISAHWSISDCKAPHISEDKKELLKGLLMGDGYVQTENKTPSFQWLSINYPFMKWFSDKMDVISGRLFFDRTAEDSVEDVTGKTDWKIHPENYHDVYRWDSIAHPYFDEFATWYSSGKKKYPEDLELTPECVKIWYCGDGNLVWSKNRVNASIEINCKNESERTNWLQKLFEESGFSCKVSSDGTIRFNVNESKKLIKWMGEAPPGMDYKWEVDDRENYKKLKQKAYEKSEKGYVESNVEDMSDL